MGEKQREKAEGEGRGREQRQRAEGERRGRAEGRGREQRESGEGQRRGEGESRGRAEGREGREGRRGESRGSVGHGVRQGGCHGGTRRREADPRQQQVRSIHPPRGRGFWRFNGPVLQHPSET